jgi:MoaA/NifB/PqqE/SkfB family radical SAM enzyme
MCFTCYGEAMGCTLTHISFGNVKRESLRTIWERATKFSQFRKGLDRCLVAFDHEYRAEFLEPIAELPHRPVRYTDHPKINATTEPDVFRRD